MLRILGAGRLTASDVRLEIGIASCEANPTDGKRLPRVQGGDRRAGMETENRCVAAAAAVVTGKRGVGRRGVADPAHDNFLRKRGVKASWVDQNNFGELRFDGSQLHLDQRDGYHSDFPPMPIDSTNEQRRSARLDRKSG